MRNMDIDVNSMVDYALRAGADFADVRYQEHVYENIIFDNGVLRNVGVSISKGIE